jgi:hypothetical protein
VIVLPISQIADVLADRWAADRIIPKRKERARLNAASITIYFYRPLE